jgi:Nickel responsive protein SCO4226-like
MPRYVVERTFVDGLPVERYLAQVDRNADEGVTWIQSYVSEDGSQTYCVLEGPSPEAIRKAAAHNRLPVDRITEVRILDPYLRV